MNTYVTAVLSVTIVLLCSGIAVAQSGAVITTDRPSLSLSPATMNRNTWQFESGYLYTRNNSDNDTHTLPQLLLRYGLSDETELQLDWSGYTSRDGNNGFSDISIGGKWRLTEYAAATQFAFFAGLSIPAGDSGFTSDSYDPTLKFIWSHSSSLNWFGTAAVIQSDGDTSFTNGIGLAFPIDEQRSWFVEHALTIPDKGDSTHALNGGVLFLRGARAQIDIHGSVGLSDGAADFAIGVGYSAQF